MDPIFGSCSIIGNLNAEMRPLYNCKKSLKIPKW